MAIPADRLPRTVSLAATILVAAFVVLPPSIYFAVSYEHAAGVVGTEAEINARLVSRVISANPELWTYEQLRISEYLVRRPVTRDPERRRVLDGRGAVVAENSDPLSAPLLTRSVPLYDAGVPVGALEVSRSLRPPLYKSGLLAVGLLAAGLLSFRMVRTIPLRAVERSQDALRRERDTAQRYLDVAGVAFVSVDEAGRVTMLNRRGCELLGRPEHEVLGREWSDFVAPPHRAHAAAALAAAERTDDVIGREYAVVRPSGERRIVSWYLTPLLDADRRRTGVLASGVDITHQSQLEHQLRKAQRLEAIGRLAGGVAHDFNNVLSVLKVKAELLRRNLEDGDPRRRFTDDILASTDRAAALTRDLLTFGRQHVLRPERIDAIELLKRTEPSLRALVREGIELRLAAPPEPLPVLAEPLELERVLMNLVTNAQDAMPGGGRIEVSASRAILDGAAAAAAGVDRPGAYAALSVADTGTGIAPEAQASLFEPFFTTKAPGKGTGLGLSIAYAIMKQHGGAIRVASEPGKGATFTLLLPLVDGEPHAAPTR